MSCVILFDGVLDYFTQDTVNSHFVITLSMIFIVSFLSTARENCVPYCFHYYAS